MDERCENCKFLCMLNVFDRGLKTIGGHGCISGVKNDKCELFQPKEKEEENHGEK